MTKYKHTDNYIVNFYCTKYTVGVEVSGSHIVIDRSSDSDILNYFVSTINVLQSIEDKTIQLTLCYHQDNLLEQSINGKVKLKDSKLIELYFELLKEMRLFSDIIIIRDNLYTDLVNFNLIDAVMLRHRNNGRGMRK